MRVKEFRNKKNKLNKLKSDIKKTVLDNGLTIVSEEISSTYSFSAGIMINAGSRDDIEGKEGIAHFLEHMIFRSSKNKSARKIAMEFESVGAYSNAYTNQEFTCYYVKSQESHFRKTISLLLEIVFNPLFDDEEFEKEKQIIVEEIKSALDDPEEYIFDIADEKIFKGHELSKPILGKLESVERIEKIDLKEFHSKYYNYANMVISVSGSIGHERIVRIVEEFCKNQEIKSVYRPIRDTKFEYFWGENSIDQKINQQHIVMALPVCGIYNDDKYSLNIINVMLGGGMSSRLYQDLREKAALAYTVYSNIELHHDHGAIYIYIACDKSNASISKNMIIKNIEQLIEGKISESEVKRAKEQIKSSFIFEMENLTERMQAIARNELIYGYNPALKDTFEKYNLVSKKEIIQSIAKYFDLEKISTIELK